MTRRTERIGDLLRTTLAEIILRESNDPRTRLVTVTSVDVSPDFQQALVSVSALGDDAGRDDAVGVLNRARGFYRSRLANRLRNLRRVPELHFRLDRGAEHSQKISDILEELQ